MSLNPNYVYKARVVNVVDGDTIDVDIDLGFRITTRQRIRMTGIDTPELRGVKADPLAAQLAKEHTIERLFNKNVTLFTAKSDSFGRWLATIYINGENFNEELMSQGFAVKFRR